MSKATRLALLRELKAQWEIREECPLCHDSGMDGEDECGNCHGVGVVPACTWEEANKEDARELARLEMELS